MSQSARLKIPHIDAGQIDKATTHNEGLALIDLLIGAAVDGFLVNTPPASPMVGACYIIGGAPTDAWAGHAGALAGFTAGGWRFVAPTEGLSATEKASGEPVTFRAGDWEKGQVRANRVSIGGDQVVGARQAAVADPSGGTTIDTEARSAIAALLARLRQHGLIAN